MSDRGTPHINGEELARAAASDRRLFEKKLARLRLLGVSDREIVAAMAAARTLISPLKVRP
jgi:hypothetical protein